MEAERFQRRGREQKEAQETTERNRNCAYARDRLRRYQEAGTLYNLDGQGERRVLSETERAASHKMAEDDIAKWCTK